MQVVHIAGHNDSVVPPLIDIDTWLTAHLLKA